MSKMNQLLSCLACAIGVHAPAFAQSSLDFLPIRQDDPAAARESYATQDGVTEGEVLDEPGVVADDFESGMKVAGVKLVEATSPGIRLVQVGSGLAVLASGDASYSTRGKNQNLKLERQRLAFFEAHLRAKTELTEFLNGLSLEAKTSIAESMSFVDVESEEGSLSNSETTIAEEWSSIVRGILKAVVVYDMHDDPEAKSDSGLVRVVVATSPKVQSILYSHSSNVIATSDLPAALDAVIAEIRSGVVPPLGARVIWGPDDVPFCIGYGSALIRTNRSPSMQRKLQEMATSQAASRAKTQLLNLMSGEEIESQEASMTEYVKAEKQFELDQESQGIEPDDSVEEMLFGVFSEEMSSKTSGQLPPGCIHRNYVSEDGNWAYTISVFNAGTSEYAKKLASAIRNASPGKSPFRSESSDGGDNGQKPSSLGQGRVTQDKDL